MSKIDLNKINLIITADDLGRTPEANKAIKEMYDKGLITHTSIMLINNATEDAVNLNINKEDIGLHFNAIESLHPLTYNKELNVNYKNNFAYYLNNKRSFFFLTHKEKQFIRNELEAQLAKFNELNYKCRSFDSHGHTHTRLPVAKLIIPILKKYDIKIIRLPFSMKQTHKLYKRFIANLFRKHFKTVDYFIDGQDLINLNINQHKGKIFELMLHPYYENNKIINRRETISMDQILNFISKHKSNINLMHVNELINNR